MLEIERKHNQYLDYIINFIQRSTIINTKQYNLFKYWEVENLFNIIKISLVLIYNIVDKILVLLWATKKIMIIVE